MFAGLPLAAQDEGLVPLSEELDEMPLNDAYIRCTSLFIATIGWAGADRLGAERAQNFQNAGMFFGHLSISGLEEGAGADMSAEEIENLRKAVIDSIKSMEYQYLFRFQYLLQNEGIAIDSDEVWLSDIETCSTLASEYQNG